MCRVNGYKNGLIVVAMCILASCSATSAKPDAKSVAIVTEVSDTERCRFLGEVVGSQGNWLTGAYTSDKNLLVGARNDLRNATHELGGNTVHIQHFSNSARYDSSGNANTTIIGNAYDCK